MEVPSQTFMSQVHIEVDESGCVITEATAGSHVAPTVPCADVLEVPDYHEPPLMSSVSVTENPFFSRARVLEIPTKHRDFPSRYFDDFRFSVGDARQYCCGRRD